MQRTTYGHESGDFFAVFNELNSDTLPDSRVGLLGFDTNFFQNDTLGM